MQVSPARHCMIAELSAMLAACARLTTEEDGSLLVRIHAERKEAADKCCLLLEKLFGWKEGRLCRTGNLVEIVRTEDAERLLNTAKLKPEEEAVETGLAADNLIVQNTCCKRAFIRGTFLCTGSVNDPEKAYHFEIVLPDEARARQMQNIINSFSIDAKVILRKRYYVVYVKEGAQIVDLLNIMEAHRALMQFENVRILKEVRNSVNRQVNCEAANINKTVTAASRQIDDIIFIRDKVGFDKLSEGLEEIARLRIEYPEATLKELGAMLNPPIGKSGVNHRLRKLGEIAEGYR